MAYQGHYAPFLCSTVVRYYMTFSSTSQPDQLGLYIHIPFCRQACYYCNFHFSTNLAYKSSLMACLKREIILRKYAFDKLYVGSIYIGGGTPSVLDTEELESLICTVFANFSMDVPTLEVTLEANPDDVTLSKALAWKQMGINRLSLGIQSFDNHILRHLNRKYDGHVAKQSIVLARQAQFDNINLDLIYGIPCATTSDFASDLKVALDFFPEHLSLYGLTIESKTVFGHWKQQGKYSEVPEEMAIEQFNLAQKICRSHGYIHYEISNFCRSGRFSKHNTNCWKQGMYLGIGPGAHSYDGSKRGWNIANNALYMKSIQQDQIPYNSEVLTLEDHVNEYILTRLRTCWGCDLIWIDTVYGVNLWQLKYRYIDELVTNHFVQLAGNKLYLTDSGMLIADTIAQNLFIEKGA